MNEFETAREERAQAELSSYSFKKLPTGGAVSVRKNGASGVPYLVSRNGCTCNDYVTRCAPVGTHCKHMRMVAHTAFGKALGLTPGEGLPSPEILKEALRLAKEYEALWETTKDAESFLKQAEANLARNAYRRHWLENAADAWEDV